MKLTVKTSVSDQIVDITDAIEEKLSNQQIENGVCVVFVKHTTCAITTADLDPGTDEDFLHFLRKITPSMNFNHPHDPSHTPDHLLSSIIGPQIIIPFLNGRLDLGVWQRVVLVELSGPRVREISLTIVSS